MTLEGDNIFVNCMSVDVIVHSFPWFKCYIRNSGASASAPMAMRYRCEKIGYDVSIIENEEMIFAVNAIYAIA